MSQHSISPEISFPPHHSEGTGRIWKTFWLLSVVIIIELVIGLAIYNIHKGEHPNHTLILAFKGMVCILTIAKAYYIVSVFMHLGDEIRNFHDDDRCSTDAFHLVHHRFPLGWKQLENLRNTDAGSRPNTEQVAPCCKKRKAQRPAGNTVYQVFTKTD